MAEIDPDLRRDADVGAAVDHVYDATGSIDDTP